MKGLKKVTFAFIIAFVSLNCAYASTDLDLEEQVKQESIQERVQNSFIIGQILEVKVIKTGEITIESLKQNLNFINKLENDPSFRKCIVLQEGIKRIKALKSGANELYNKKEISANDYKNYINKLNQKTINLNKKISNICKETK